MRRLFLLLACALAAHPAAAGPGDLGAVSETLNRVLPVALGEGSSMERTRSEGARFIITVAVSEAIARELDPEVDSLVFIEPTCGMDVLRAVLAAGGEVEWEFVAPDRRAVSRFWYSQGSCDRG